MNSFGLGLVLNFVDNASSGMNSATNTFLTMSNTIQQASASASASMQQFTTGMVLNQLGSAFTNFGNSVVGTIAGVMNNVKQVGSDFQLFNVTLQQIYGSAEAAESQIQKLLDFSVKSPFEVADTKDLLVVLKSQGIEAFDTIKGSISGVEQQTLQWMSDLMAFKPEVPMQKWKLAFQNYIGSGEQKMLRNLLDMGSIDQILGHDVSGTIEGRMNDIIEIVEKKNLTGLTENMFGTMQQNISNISDFFTMFYKAIGDAGVFDNLAAITGTASKLLSEFDNESGKLPQIAAIIADSFNFILQPVVALTQNIANLIKGFLDFAIAHPALGKIATVIFAISGAGMVAIGWIMKLSGSILTFVATLKMLGGANVIMGAIGTGLVTLGGFLVWLIPLGALLYSAWSNNFMGLQDKVGGLSQKLGLIWDYFKQGYFTDEQYNLAQQLGLLGAVETLVTLSYLFGKFKEGFVSGWNDASTQILNALNTITQAANGSAFQPLTDKIKNFFSALSGKDAQAWNNFGFNLGDIALKVMTVVSAIMTLKKGISIFGGLAKGASALFSLIAANPVIAIIVAIVGLIVILYTQCADFRNGLNQIFGAIGQLFAKLAPAIMQIISAIVNVIIQLLPTIQQIIMAIMNVIIQLLPVIMQIVDAVVPFIIDIVNLLAQLISNILPIIIDLINYLLPIIMDLVNTLIPVIQNIITALMPVIKIIMNIVTTLIANLIPVIQDIVVIIAEIIKIIVNIAVPIIKVIMQIVMVIVQVLAPILGVIINIIGFIINIIVGIVRVVVNVIKNIVVVISGIVSVIMSIINAIVQGIMAVVQFIVGIVTTVINTIASIINGIIYVVQAIWNGIVNIFSGVVDFFGGIFSAVFNVVTGVFTSIGNFFTNVWNGIVTAFTTIGDTISGAIKGAINAVLSGAIKIINGFINAINFAIDVINAIPGVSVTKLNLLTVPQLAKGTESFAGGPAIINEVGGELVDLPQGTRVIPHDESIKESLREGIRMGAKAMSQYNGVNSNGTPISNASGSVAQDNRVIFSEGSIVITTVGATIAEMEKAAEFIMRYIERKQKLRSMAVRT